MSVATGRRDIGVIECSFEFLRQASGVGISPEVEKKQTRLLLAQMIVKRQWLSR
jgi:hypothetical protein